MQQRAHTRVDAVGADQRPAPVELVWHVLLAAGEARDQLVSDRLEVGQGLAADDAIAAETLAGDAMQQQLQLAAVQRELGEVVPGRAAARLRPDRLAVAVEVGELGRLDRARGELVL
jgi:hypothetical protein